MLDLTTWNLTVPATSSTTLITTQRLNAGYSSQYFRPQRDHSVVFWVPVNGSRTASARYPRSELRETLRNGTLHNWYFSEADNILSAVLSVQQLPSKNKLVIGQIHSKDEPGSNNDPLLKLQYHLVNGTGRIEALLRKYPGDSTVQNIILVNDVSLDERFSYQLRLTPSGRLRISVHSADDNGTYYRQLSSSWGLQQLYFKAGAYAQDNYGPSSEGARATFYHLNTLHRKP
ncbi:polysaccharide lyase family 7 protein [Aquipseudomonas ullengensis]|uniref:Polysaccharide lyase family 7 protein n=1 Tax=Aquipseudomonas ullengensis TaxID=2759166 RepID=A0A7W4LKD7_9GAMM|nr:polysaccharide lyase family 7 protein [Pseudomonas ullengensis]MBB2494766.1 polysaccharide lyase family 7 protein [Pseudomonas ullengensis]